MTTFINILKCLILILIAAFIMLHTISEIVNRRIEPVNQTLESLEREFNRWRSRALIDEKYIKEHVKGVKK